MRKHLVVATRGSALALWQANWVKRALESLDPSLSVSLNVIKTKGDVIGDVPLAQLGGKGIFVKEIEEALLDGRADLAVHSVKDMPMELPEGLIIGCVPKRADVRDCFISNFFPSLDALPPGASVATGSLRRQAQLLAWRPDLRIKPIRGNVDTRLRKLNEGYADALILACAGVKRLGLNAPNLSPIPINIILPAAGQGALGVECHEDNYELLVLLASLEDRYSRVCVDAERAFTRTLDAGCHAPVAANAEMIDEERITLRGLVGAADGSEILRDQVDGDASLSEQTGRDAAKQLEFNGARRLLEISNFSSH